MGSVLNIELLNEEGNKLLARVDDEQVLVGRTPAPSGIALPSSSVSSTHGKFVRFANTWFYRDLSSTNGSWFDKHQLSPTYYHLVKDKDTLLISNVPVRLSVNHAFEDESVEIYHGHHLYLFWQDELITVFPLSEEVPQCVIGGIESDVNLPNEYTSRNLMVFKLDDDVCKYELYQTSEDVYCNHQAMQQPSKLNLDDRSNVIAGQLLVVYCSGIITSGVLVEEEQQQEPPQGTFIDPSVSYTKKVITNTSFGKLPEEETDLDRKIKTMSMRRTTRAQPQFQNFDPDKLIYFIAFLGLVVVLGLLIWFVLS